MSKYLYNFEYQNKRSSSTGPVRQKIVPGWMKR